MPTVSCCFGMRSCRFRRTGSSPRRRGWMDQTQGLPPLAVCTMDNPLLLLSPDERYPAHTSSGPSVAPETYRRCAWSHHPVQSCQELVTPESDGKGWLRLEKIVVSAYNQVHRCTGWVRWASAKLGSAPHRLKSYLANAGKGICRRGWSSCHCALGCTGMHWDVSGCKAVGSLEAVLSSLELGSVFPSQ